MTAVLVSNELLFASRIMDAAARAGEELLHVDAADQLPSAASVRLALVDWSGPAPMLPEVITAWLETAPSGQRPRVILFGPHTDLEGHASARAAGLGPMWARSKLLHELDGLFQPPD